MLGPSLQRLPRNRAGRDIVIGDIHGHFARVERELGRIDFDSRRDRLICCGDLVDRGPASELALEWLARSWFFSVLGNHDASLLQRAGLLSAKFELWHDYHDWLPALDTQTQQQLIARLAALPWALEIETAHWSVGVVHAEVPVAFSDWQQFTAALSDEEVRSQAVSSRTLARQALDLGTAEARDRPPLPGVGWVVHGHTPRRGCRPGQWGNRLWIDTMGWYDRPTAEGSPCFTLLDAADPLTLL